MKFWKAALKLGAIASVFPYKITSTPVSEEENAKNRVSVEAFAYRVEVEPNTAEAGTPKNGKVNISIPGPVLSRTIESACTAGTNAKEKAAATAETVKEKAAAATAVAKEKAAVAKEKATALKEKALKLKDTVVKTCTETVEKIKVKCMGTQEILEGEPEEEITVEIVEEPTVEEPAAPEAPEAPAEPEAPKAKKSKKKTEE